MFEPVADARVFNEVGRIRKPCFARAVVLDLQAARTGNIMDIVATNFGMRFAIAIEKRE